MPKMRSHSSTKKRIRVTGSGKFRRGQAGIRHLAPATTSKQSRHLPSNQKEKEIWWEFLLLLYQEV